MHRVEVLVGEPEPGTQPQEAQDREREEDVVEGDVGDEALVVAGGRHGGHDEDDGLHALQRDDDGLEHLAREEPDPRLVGDVHQMRQALLHHLLVSAPSVRGVEEGVGCHHIDGIPRPGSDPTVRDDGVAPEDRGWVVVADSLMPLWLVLAL